MAYTSGLLKDRVTVLNRREAQQGKFGLDSAGIEFEPAATVWASVDWAKGKSALNAGALDAYAVKMVRMRWNSIVNENAHAFSGMARPTRYCPIRSTPTAKATPSSSSVSRL